LWLGSADLGAFGADHRRRSPRRHGRRACTSPAASGGAGHATPHRSAGALRAQGASLASRSSEALLGLYSLDERLARIRAQLAALRGRQAALALENASVHHRLSIARYAFRVSQRRLAAHIRDLYERGEADPLAVILGASSIEEAMTGLDTLNSVASQDRGVIEQTTATRRTLSRLERGLAARMAAVRSAEQAASATAASLARAHAEREAYLARLAAERRLTARQLVGLEAASQSAQAKSAQLTSARPAQQTVTPAPGASLPSAPATPGSTMTVSSTGYALPGTTATGIPVAWGVVAVDPAVIPLGTKLTIPGYGEGVAADTGSAVRGATIDLWFPTTAQALAWGRRTVTVTLH